MFLVDWLFVKGKAVVKSSFSGVCDLCDRLNYTVTTGLFILTLFIISWNQFIEKPMVCYPLIQPRSETPQQLIVYMHHFCWINGTYAIQESEILNEKVFLKQTKINYYQWIPYLIILFLLLFTFPFMLWDWICNHQGRAIIRLFSLIYNYDSANGSEDEVEKAKEILLEYHTRIVNLPPCEKCQVTILLFGTYTLMKVIYLSLNFTILHLFLWFLEYNVSSFHMLHTFPLRTYCHLNIPSLGVNKNMYPAICLLPINRLYAVLFLFFIGWFILMAIISVINFLYWLLFLIIKSMFRREKHVSVFLTLLEWQYKSPNVIGLLKYRCHPV